MEKMSTGQYGKLIGKTRQDIHYMIKTGQRLPGVRRREVIAGRIILSVEKNNLKKVEEKFGRS